MLNDLYQYAIKNELTSRPGFKPKSVKAYIHLTKEGKFIALDPAPPEKVMCPDIGSAALGISKCNILTEKAEIVLAINPTGNIPVKHKFYRDALESGMNDEPLFKICLRAIDDESILTEIKETFLKSKYKPSDIIGFKVDGQAVEQSQGYWNWWECFRKEQGGKPSKGGNMRQERCLITGKLTEPVVTVPKVSGLHSVGGHTAGDSFICFDKDAFCSYNLKQAANASVSEEAVVIMNAALNDLIAKAPIHAGTKFVHWYKEPIDSKYDLCNLLDLGFDDESNINDQEDDGNESSESGGTEIKALSAAKRLIESVKRGEFPQLLNNRYYIMSMSGASGRIMVRCYLQGSYEDLYNNFKKWFEDLRIINRYGKGFSGPPKLSALYYRLLKREKVNKNIGERMAKELSGLDSQIKYAIINGTPLPDSAAARALAYIRSDMLDSSEESKAPKIPDMLCCEILKAWLIRKYQNGMNKAEEGVKVQERLNRENPSIAYHVGRMMAVYAIIQREAMGDIGAGIIQRYYASASTSPALVIGKLAVLSQYHLDKIENKNYVVRYNKMLSEIASKIGTAIPRQLTLEEQSQFALGYYQQTAAIYESNHN